MNHGLRLLALLLLPVVAGAAGALTILLSRSDHPGPWLWWSWAMALIGAGVLCEFLVLAIGRQRHLEQELLQARRDVNADPTGESRRLALLGSLAAGLAHELGQPLSAARVGIEGIHYLRQLGREPSSEHVERTFSRVGMSILAMTQTIEHLRGLASPPQQAALQAMDLAACVDAVVAERDQWLRYNDTHIVWERPATPVPGLVDPAGMRLILTNLLRNAVEAVAGQGENRRLVRLTVGPGAVVSIHDSGPGIAPDSLDSIFDPFFSTKGGGVRGIGLSLARASAQRMGADLTVVSNLGSGSVFTLRLRGPT